jgi:cyclopropane-fatty-acyl-phospholipid synthase
MNSLLVPGKVEHVRTSPVVHAFTYPLYFLAVDLDELAELDRSISLFSYNSTNALCLFDDDYLPGYTGGLRDKVAQVLSEGKIEEDLDHVVLVTTPRSVFRVFNPVSFFLCFRADKSLICVIAEVKNTFRETHLYLLGEKEEIENNSYKVYETRKDFHVSPFNDMEGKYRFYFDVSSSSIDVRVNIVRGRKVVFTTKLFGVGCELETPNILKTLGKFPLAVHLALPRITFQAARLHYQKGLRVFTKPIAASPMTIRTSGPSLFQSYCLDRFRSFFSNISVGSLELSFPDGSSEYFGASEVGPKARIYVKNHAFFTKAILGGDIGFGEAYVEGYWETEDLDSVFRLIIANLDVADDRSILLSWLGRTSNRVLHKFRKNKISRSAVNIGAHYDLSNELFALFLDPSMTYSAAFYEKDSDTLEQAQKNKRSLLLKQAHVGADDHVLEIGCGWGSLAIQAVRETGCRVTALTLSQRQFEYARNRVCEAGLSDRISIELRDYRTMEGSFDKILSVEMLEAVGHEYLRTFFSSCDRNLKPDGIAAIQVITMPESRYERYKNGCDWIQKYIFPGGHCPSLTAISEAIRDSSTLMFESVENIGDHYARTLRDWRTNFAEREAEVLELGFDERFLRIWNYYLAYCEAGFASRNIGTHQIVLTRRNNLRLSSCPAY